MNWFQRLLSGKPHFIIGANNPDGPYLFRWFLLPRNHRLNIYLHKFLRDDDDRALHDHPWWFVSIMLRGSYLERVEDGYIERSAPSICFRPAIWRHRVILKTQTVWTLVITGRKMRTWGFYCPQGFVPWQQFTASTNSGEVGKGCDQ